MWLIYTRLDVWLCPVVVLSLLRNGENGFLFRTLLTDLVADIQPNTLVAERIAHQKVLWLVFSYVFLDGLCGYKFQLCSVSDCIIGVT